MKYSFQEEAQAEFLEQLSNYREKDLGLSQDFNNKVKETINRILKFPEAWTLVDEVGTRRALVKEYPFAILYQYDEENKHIKIFAVMHTARKPGYWKNRK